jgi:hypothetical protein
MDEGAKWSTKTARRLSERVAILRVVLSAGAVEPLHSLHIRSLYGADAPGSSLVSVAMTALLSAISALRRDSMRLMRSPRF